jgi:predicted AAA+ superfamily ATPase
VYAEFKGSLSEQFVLQQLKAIRDIHISYWSPEAGKAEIDFVVQLGNRIIPVEVKAEKNLKAKSLKSYRDKYRANISVRASMASFKNDGGLINIPLYLIAELFNIVEKQS